MEFREAGWICEGTTSRVVPEPLAPRRRRSRPPLEADHGRTNARRWTRSRSEDWPSDWRSPGTARPGDRSAERCRKAPRAWKAAVDSARVQDRLDRSLRAPREQRLPRVSCRLTRCDHLSAASGRSGNATSIKPAVPRRHRLANSLSDGRRDNSATIRQDARQDDQGSTAAIDLAQNWAPASPQGCGDS